MARASHLSFDRAAGARIVHPYAWLWEPLELDPTFVLRPMFGTKAAYVGGRLTLCFSARREPWRGILIATEQSHHPSLQRDYPALVPHPILPKWLYLPETAPRFEATAEKIVWLVRQRDPRIGVEPKSRERRQTRKSRPGRTDAVKRPRLASRAASARRAK